MSAASTEACPSYPSDILWEIKPLELFTAINKCPREQLRYIDYHHTNTRAFYRQACLQKALGNQAAQNTPQPDVEIACGLHDLGKILVHRKIFPLRLSKALVKLFYDSHAANTLKLLGKEFCQLYPQVAQHIIHHHWHSSNYLSKADQQQLDLTIIPLNELDKKDLRKLGDFVISDMLVAQVEDRQHNKHKDDKSNNEIIANVQQDIKFLNLPDSFINSINFPALVDISKSVCLQNQDLLKPT